MNCYYHPETTSIGLCKSCGKGLCSNCAVDLEAGLACRNRCEGDVADIGDMIARSRELAMRSASSCQSTRHSWLPANLLIFGVILIALAMLTGNAEPALIPGSVASGIAVVLFGVNYASRKQAGSNN